MKPYIPRLIAFGITAIMAVIQLLLYLSPENAILICALLAALALTVFVGKKKTVAGTASAFVVAWIYFGILASVTPLTIDTFLFGLENLVESLTDAPGILIVLLIAFGGVQLFLRSSNSFFPISLRYFLLGAAQLTWCCSMDGNAVELIPLLLLNLVIHYARELLSRPSEEDLMINSLKKDTANNNQRQICTLRCLLIGLCCLFIPCLSGNKGVTAVMSLVSLSSGSLYTILGIALLGGIMILEEKIMYRHNDPNEFARGLGGMLIYWSVTALIMLIWQDAANMLMMTIAPLILFYAYKAFAKTWDSISGRRMTSAMYHLIWALSFLTILIIAKCITVGNVLATVFLMIAPVAAAVCWYIGRRNNAEAKVMVCFLGMASMLLLSFAKNVDMDNLAAVVKLLLAAGGLSVFWCLLSSQIFKFHNTASAVDKAEFSIVKTIHIYVPLLVLSVAVIKLIFA